MFDILASPDAWVALLTLTFLEIVLGIDNIVFISIVANKLPQKDRQKATNIGLLLAMVQRIILLFAVSFLIGLKNPYWSEVYSSYTKAHRKYMKKLNFRSMMKMPLKRRAYPVFQRLLYKS